MQQQYGMKYQITTVILSVQLWSQKMDGLTGFILDLYFLPFCCQAKLAYKDKDSRNSASYAWATCSKSSTVVVEPHPQINITVHIYSPFMF